MCVCRRVALNCRSGEFLVEADTTSQTFLWISESRTTDTQSI